MFQSELSNRMRTSPLRGVHPLIEGRHLRIETENDLALFHRLTTVVQDHVKQFGYKDQNTLLEIAMALEESLSNAVVHGNLEISSELRDDPLAFRQLIEDRRHRLPYRSRRVFIDVQVDDDKIVIVVRDEGSGFDLEAVPDPLDPANQHRRHGRGLLLIRSFMENVKHNPSGNEITMVKRPND